MAWMKYTLDFRSFSSIFCVRSAQPLPSPRLLNNKEQRNHTDFQFTPCSPSFNALRQTSHLVPTSRDEMQQTYHPLALVLLEINTQRKSLVKMHAMFL